MDSVWFDDWNDLLRVLIAGTVAYAVLILVLRMSGKRTLAKLNAFDLVVTVAVGSTLATVFLNSSVSVTEGIVALILLAALQYVAAIVASRPRIGRAVLTSRPSLLFAHGSFRDDAMRKQRVSRADVRQAVRSSGRGGLNDVGAVVLESDGSLSVITTADLGDHSALIDVDDQVPPAPG
ncbi:membrane protein [Mycolicibacterium monacense DSM 44395]|nr:membrane protein [Mycolicibacterium monacense DSM 44395]